MSCTWAWSHIASGTFVPSCRPCSGNAKFGLSLRLVGIGVFARWFWLFLTTWLCVSDTTVILSPEIWPASTMPFLSMTSGTVESKYAGVKLNKRLPLCAWLWASRFSEFSPLEPFLLRGWPLVHLKLTDSIVERNRKLYAGVCISVSKTGATKAQKIYAKTLCNFSDQSSAAERCYATGSKSVSWSSQLALCVRSSAAFGTSDWGRPGWTKSWSTHAWSVLSDSGRTSRGPASVVGPRPGSTSTA